MSNKKTTSTSAKKKEENQDYAPNHLNTASESDTSVVNPDYRSIVVSQIKPQEIVNN